jgi:hypothetical protein
VVPGLLSVASPMQVQRSLEDMALKQRSLDLIAIA